MDNNQLPDQQPELLPERTKDKFAEAAIQATRKGPFGFFITRHRVVVLLVLAIVMLGSLALASLPRESDPEVKIPIAIVTTFYPGASPSDIESLITDKIESRLEELDDVKLVTSGSISSLSSIVVEFEAEADLDESINKLKDKVDEVRGLPDEAEDPVVTQIRANDYPIITFSLAGDLTETELKQLGEEVQSELESISGVSEAPLLGVQDKEFSVIVNKESLRRLNLSLSQIVGSISASNLDLPLGSISIDNVDYNLRTVAKFTSLEDLQQVVVAVINNQPVLLRDVAEVKEQFKEKTTISQISIDNNQPVDSVSLQIFKKTGGNILNIVDAAKAKIEQLQEEEVIPTDVRVEVSNDYSQFIRNDLNTLGRSGIQSTVLIFLIMLVALSFKEALISFIAIPLTFFITFFFLNHFGYTLNSLSLFTLVLSLGLLVDTFIVMLEGIFHNMRSGYNSTEAALLSVAHYKYPLISGILTTISAFVPMLLVSGILGEYLKVLPITISITLLSSLFVSLVLVPSMAAILLRKSKISQYKKDSILEKYATNRLRAWYRDKVNKFLLSKKYKLRFLATIILLFFISLGLLIGGVIPVKLFPQVDVDFIFVDIEMPIGTDLLATQEVVSLVENELYGNPNIASFVSTIGQSSSFGFDSASTKENLANVNINLVSQEERKVKSFELEQELREKFKSINAGKVTIQEISGGPPTGAPIEVRILGKDLLILDNLSTEVMSVLESTEGVINVSSNRDVSPADLTFSLNKETLAKVGLSVAEVSTALRSAIFGVTATEVSLNGEDFDVVVKFDKNKINTIEQIQNLSIINRTGQEVKLSYLADFSLQPALAAIRHRGFERTITIQTDLEPGYTPSVVVPQVEKKIQEMGIPAGYQVKFGGEVEDIEQSFSELWNAMIVAVLLIILILVLQFNSFSKPLIIMLSLPLTLIGIVAGMLLLGLDFSFSVFLGLISLAGIVVNDAIVLLDKANRNVKEKLMTAREAIVDAGDTRLQPILLTSITTIVGVAPLAWADEFWLGLSVSIIFGLAFATVLQLFVIPMFYLKMQGKRVNKQLKELSN